MISNFEEEAIALFHTQYSKCEPYRKYVNLLGIDPSMVKECRDIPFMPIEFFKTEKIITGSAEPEIVFTSSSTTGMTPARHFVTDIELYKKNFTECFKYFYGDPTDYIILALLPSYLEREGSSLVYMVNELMRISGKQDNGYYLYNHAELVFTLKMLQSKRSSGAIKEKVMLIGVSFALVEFAENYHVDFPDLIVMETGGMKGKRREISRTELHEQLVKSFGVHKIHSEYGMAELLSQAYSKGDGLFETPPQMRIMVRDLTNPFKFVPDGTLGGINIIDLANRNSCAFIETQDMGSIQNGLFTVAGRIHGVEIRGCNLLIE